MQPKRLNLVALLFKLKPSTATVLWFRARDQGNCLRYSTRQPYLDFFPLKNMN